MDGGAGTCELGGILCWLISELGASRKNCCQLYGPPKETITNENRQNMGKNYNAKKLKHIKQTHAENRPTETAPSISKEAEAITAKRGFAVSPRCLFDVRGLGDRWWVVWALMAGFCKVVFLWLFRMVVSGRRR